MKQVSASFIHLPYILLIFYIFDDFYNANCVKLTR